MSTTLTPRPAVRQPYFLPLARRAATWTATVVTALAAGQYVGLVFGLTGATALAVGVPVGAALGLLAYIAFAGRQRWAQVALAALWSVWALVGWINRGFHGSTLPLIEAVALTGMATTVVLALGDVRRQRLAGR